MVEVKIRKRRQEKYHSEYYYRYFDLRAIAPAMLIALIWSLAITFYAPTSAIAAYIVKQSSVAVKYPELSGFVVDILLKAFIFIFDFIVVFLICYFVLWVVWKEQDKRLMLQMKKKRQI